MTDTKLCYWCHEALPSLPEDASYVDEINHYAHESCLEERDARNRRMDQLRAGIADGSIDSIPEAVRKAVLDRIETSGFLPATPREISAPGNDVHTAACAAPAPDAEPS
ncbi:MAG TPA: hypothetical protein VG929_08445 [Actinomycetota bacterium]|nr:hypothetical protein [Actinomycetota bacterium]